MDQSNLDLLIWLHLSKLISWFLVPSTITPDSCLNLFFKTSSGRIDRINQWKYWRKYLLWVMLLLSWKPAWLYLQALLPSWSVKRTERLAECQPISHLNSHDPGAVPPSKPLSADDLQGRLWVQRSWLRWRSAAELCSWRSAALGFGRRDGWSRRRGVLSLPWGLASFHPRLALWPRRPARFIPTRRAVSCLLSHNDIVNGNNTAAYREVSAVTMDEWRRNGMANLSCCHLGAFGGARCVPAARAAGR